MITSLLMKPLNAGWLTTLYIVAAGLLSWPTLVVAIGLAESPVDAVLAALAAFVIDPPRGLETATLWAEARKIPLTLAAITTLVAGFVWAMGWLWQRPMLFHKLRGPATAWIMVALLTQLHGRAAILFSGVR